MASINISADQHIIDFESILSKVSQKFLDEIQCLSAVIVSSCDNICFCKAFKGEEMNPKIATIFPVIAEQIGKHRWGMPKILTAEFEEVIVVHVFISSLMFTFVGLKDLDTATLASNDMYERLQSGFSPLINVL